MGIIAKKDSSKGSNIPLIEAGSYAARCYSMVHIGTIDEVISGKTKTLDKVRIGWELPTELYEFKEERGEEPRVISKEYTLSLYEKSNLRPMLESWRGKAFTDKEAEAFDISVLVGVPCMLSIIHRHADNGKTYANISSVTTLPKGMDCPEQINPSFLLDYDNFDMEKVNSLPDFIQEKIFSSQEFNALQGEAEHEKRMIDPDGNENAISETPAGDDLPF